MKLILLVAVFLAVGQSGVLCQDIKVAICHFAGTSEDPNIKGFIRFTKHSNNDRTIVEVEVEGITTAPSSPHAIHVHQYGDLCNQTSGMSAGPHFVGAGSPKHGCENNGNEDRHAGDLGNWDVVDGKVNQRKELKLLPLHGEHSILGRSVVIHSKADDCTSQPTGDAGSRLAFCVIGSANASTAQADLTSVPDIATCTFKSLDSTKTISGAAWIKNIDGQKLDVTARVSGLDGKPHGFHIHQYGDMSDSKGMASGGHFNPGGDVHSLPHKLQRHFGDLGNIRVYDKDGIAWYKEQITLSKAEYNLAYAVGRAIVVHSAEDDGCTQPTGNAGSRLAICVIGVANPASVVLELPVGLSIPAQRAVDCSSPVVATDTTANYNSIIWAMATFGIMMGLLVAALYWRSKPQPKEAECNPETLLGGEREKLT